jgi:hypothetical protein
MNQMEISTLAKEYLFNRTVLFDTRTKQRVVITSYSYNINKIKESNLVIEPLKMIGVKDNSHMYEPSEAYNMGLTKHFNEWFNDDPKVLFDDFDVLKEIVK